MKKLNWRLIAVHAIAAGLLIYACELFGYFSDVAFLRVLLKGDDGLTLQYIKSNNWSTVDVFDYTSWVLETWLIGLILALIVSLCVARVRHWWWVNSMVVIVIVYILRYSRARILQDHAQEWYSRLFHFPFPGSVGAFATVGASCLLCSYYLFFSPKVATIIGKGIRAK